MTNPLEDARNSLRGLLGRRRAALPGVTVEETAASPQAIAGVDTSTAAFVGTPSGGTTSGPTLVTSRYEYEQVFGTADDDLGSAVALFFANEGRKAQIVPMTSSFEDAFAALDKLRFALLVVPDLAALDPGDAAPVATLAAEVCKRRRAFLVLDAPTALAPVDVAEWAQGLGARANAAVYAPRIQLADGSETGPAGAVAGVFARTDMQRGVWKAPAGESAWLADVRGVTVDLADEAITVLAAEGVNALRRLPNGRIVVWGSRTLAVDDSQWKYVSVRRLSLFIEHSIDEGTQWAVYEPNGEALWSRVRAAVEEFLVGLYGQGALVGATSEDAFFVRCDRTTMTQADIDAGRLVVLVGFAPVRPAEFVVVRID